MKGGAYVVAGEERDTTELIVDLLQHPDVKIKLISEKSRNGVVMEMIVPSELSPFRDIDDNGMEYPIVRIICKFVLVNKKLTTYTNKNKVNAKYEVDRDTVTRRQLNQESRNLSELFNFSYQMPPPLCPAPIAEGIFDINTQSIALLKLIKEKVGSDAVHLLDLLMYAVSEKSEKSEKNTRTQLGYIVMSHVEQTLDTVTYSSLHDMYNNMLSDTDKINELMAEVHFTFARLWFVHGIMNCDAHSGNILVKLISPSPPKFKCMLIDMQEKRDISPDAYERLQTEYNNLLENQTEYKNLLKNQTDKDKIEFMKKIIDENKIGFMKKIIDEYSSIARIYRKVNYGIDDHGIDWIKWYSEGESVQLLNAANKLMTFNASLRYLPAKTITFNALPPNSTLSSSFNEQSLSSDLQPPPPPPVAAKSAAAPTLAPPHLATKSKAPKSTALLPPAPPPLTRSKRPLESKESDKNKRQRGGKSKRTRRAKSKKCRTIKRRNALKR